MIGLVYPGASRIDYDASCDGGVFPVRVESNDDPDVALWLERVVQVLPVAPRPAGYSPLGVRNVEPGWLDAEPEIRALGVERYVVNADGDKLEKRRYCEEVGIEYIVLERTPREGLPRRSSTDLRGF